MKRDSLGRWVLSDAEYSQVAGAFSMVHEAERALCAAFADTGLPEAFDQVSDQGEQGEQEAELARLVRWHEAHGLDAVVFGASGSMGTRTGG